MAPEQQVTRREFVTWALGVGASLILGMPDYQSAKEIPSSITVKPAFIDGDQNDPDSLAAILASPDVQSISPRIFITPVHPDDLDLLGKIDEPLAQQYSQALSTLHSEMEEKKLNLMYIRAKQESSIPFIGIAIATGVVSAGMIALTSEDDVNPAGCIGATVGNSITFSYCMLKIIETYTANKQALARHVQHPNATELISPLQSFEQPVVYFLTPQATWNETQKNAQTAGAKNDGMTISLNDTRSSTSSDDFESGELIVDGNGWKEK